MATVDIEPASLAVTPGESEVLTLTVRNDGDDVEAYHLTVADDAAAYVVIVPDTLLVHPGETVTAVATLTLAHTGRWAVGDMIVRFHIVPAGRPDEFLVVEAIAAIQSFVDVAAVLSSPALEARLRATAELTIANAGNAYTYADVSMSAGELALSISQSHVALPPSSAESIELRVRARSPLWRGEPKQHPFVVTVSPEGGQAISLDGAFTQLPILPRWGFAAAISVGAAVVVALLVWFGAMVRGGLSGPPTSATDSASATPSATPLPEPDVRIAMASPADDAVRAGDDVSFTLGPDVEGAPSDSLLAMEVEWPEGLILTDSECEAWIAPGADRVLEGRPRSGDECVVNTSGGRTDATLTFATPPAGLVGAVSVDATRLLMLDDDEATTLETGPDSDFGDAATADVDLSPYPFWLEVRDAEPSERGADATVIVHHVMRGDGTDPVTTMAFEVGLPGFVHGISDTHCDRRPPGSTTCSVNFNSNADDESNITREIPMWFDIDDAGGIGLLTVTGTALTDVAAAEVNQWVRGAEGLLVSESLFGVDVTLDVDEQPGQKDTVTATIEVSGVELPAEVDTYSGGSWELTLKLDWPEGLVPVGPADGCRLVDRLCTLPSLDPGEDAEITMRFVVEDASDGGEVRASGDTLSYNPTTAADPRDGRTQPTVPLPPHWIGSAAEAFPF